MDPLDRYARLKDRSDIALIKDVSYGNMEAFDELMNRYLDLVSRTSFRILCDRRDSEHVTVSVFLSLWHEVLDYDDRFTVGEWLLRKTCINARLRIMRRRILRIFGVINDVFVNVSLLIGNSPVNTIVLSVNGPIISFVAFLCEVDFLFVVVFLSFLFLLIRL